MRTIRVISTATGVNVTTIEGVPENILLSELFGWFDKHQINYLGQKVSVVQGKLTLDFPESSVPNGNITVSLSPTKVKAGVDMTYTELRDFLKNARAEAIRTNNAVVLETIGNYTQKNLDDLRATVVILQNATPVVSATAQGTNLEVRVAHLENEVTELKRRVTLLEEGLDEENSDDEDLHDEEDDDEDGLTDEERDFINRI